MSNIRWKRWIGYLLLATFLFGADSTAYGVIIGRGHDALIVGGLLAFGLVFSYGGVFGEEFNWGDDGQGAPMPRELGATIFIGVGVTFILIGLGGAVDLLISAWPGV